MYKGNLLEFWKYIIWVSWLVLPLQISPKTSDELRHFDEKRQASIEHMQHPSLYRDTIFIFRQGEILDHFSYFLKGEAPDRTPKLWQSNKFLVRTSCKKESENSHCFFVRQVLKKFVVVSSALLPTLKLFAQLQHETMRFFMHLKLTINSVAVPFSIHANAKHKKKL